MTPLVNAGPEASDGEVAEWPPLAATSHQQAPRITETHPFPGFPDPHTPHADTSPICSETPRIATISLAAPVAPAELITPVHPMLDAGLVCPSHSAQAHVRQGPGVTTQQMLADALKPASLTIPTYMELCVRSSPPSSEVQLGGVQHPGGITRDVLALDGVGLKLRQLGASHAMRISLAAAAAVQLTGTAAALLHGACHDNTTAGTAISQASTPSRMAAVCQDPTREGQYSHDADYRAGGLSQLPGHSSSMGCAAQQYGSDGSQHVAGVMAGGQAQVQQHHGSGYPCPHADASETSARAVGGGFTSQSGLAGVEAGDGTGVWRMQDLPSASQMSGVAPHSLFQLPIGQQKARQAAESQQGVNPAVLLSTFGYESDDSSLDMDLPQDWRDEGEGTACRQDPGNDLLATNASLQDWTGSASLLGTDNSLVDDAIDKGQDGESGEVSPSSVAWYFRGTCLSFDMVFRDMPQL